GVRTIRAFPKRDVERGSWRAAPVEGGGATHVVRKLVLGLGASDREAATGAGETKGNGAKGDVFYRAEGYLRPGVAPANGAHLEERRRFVRRNMYLIALCGVAWR